MRTETVTDEKKLSRQECDIENYKLVADHFNQDLREFWNRANFYLVTNAGLLSAFLVIYPTLIANHSFIIYLIPIIGIVIALLWYLVLRSSLYWIEKWRAEMVKLSLEMDRFQCFARIERQLTNDKTKSPSYLTQLMPIVFFVSWIIIAVFVAMESLI